MSGFASLWEKAEQQAAGGGYVQRAPLDWREWLPTMFPTYLKHGFSARHEEFWDYVWDIDPESAPDPFLGIWPRGGAKSTSAELATAALGLRRKRRYGLYVRRTQEQADTSVSNIGSLLEADTVERYYPEHAKRSVSKYGASRGWRRNRLRTAGGFTVDAVGLDTAARGVKVEEQRPDFIIFDDIDEKHDSAASTAKKIDIITTSVLPAGSPNVGVLAIQNLIIPDGVFTRLVDGRADFLARRIVSGPHPAVERLETAWEADPATGTRRAVIVGGAATWEGQDLTVCQHMIDTMGLSAFKKECQHEVTDRSDSLALRYDAKRHLEALGDDEARALVRMGMAFGGIDFGSWRFGFVLRAADRAGRVHQIAEYFNQRMNLETRARAIVAICEHYGCEAWKLPIWGDTANQTDIMEINAAFDRIGKSFRVIPVAYGNKIRTTGVERINDLLDRDAILYRRGVEQATAQVLAGAFKRPVDEFTGWMLGQSASNAGTHMEGSRLLWEIGHWSYPAPREGVAQEQDPNDNSADGADLLAADRYALMSWWKEAPPEARPKREKGPDQDHFAPFVNEQGEPEPEESYDSGYFTQFGTGF